MTVGVNLTLLQLKKLKNSIIGNPNAKLQLSQDDFAIQNLIECLHYPPTLESPDAIRIEVAHIIASLSYGSHEALSSLLRANAPHAVLYALNNNPQCLALQAALARSLRALASALADIAGPSQWGLRPENSSFKHEAVQELEYFFHIDSLDIYLPLLFSTTSPQKHATTSTSIAHLLASAVRAFTHRRAVVEWSPPATRHAQAHTHRAHRGWEREEGEKGGGLVVRALLDMTTGRDVKAQEAALSALAALVKDNASLATALMRTTTEFPSSLPTLLSLTKVRTPDVQLAACLCITNILRATPSNTNHTSSAYPLPSAHSHSVSPSSLTHSLHPHHSPFSNHPGNTQSTTATDPDTYARTVMSVVNSIISDKGKIGQNDGGDGHEGAGGGGAQGGKRRRPDDTPEEREKWRFGVKACFVLYHLVADDADLCLAAFERGCVDKLANLVQRLTPLPSSPTPSTSGAVTKGTPIATVSTDLVELEVEDEPEGISLLREASLTALASTALFHDDIRRFLTSSSPSTLTLPQCILASLHHPRPGVRYAACQCVRVVSRAVAVLWTGMVDSGLGLVVWEVLGKEVDGVRMRTGKVSGGESRGQDGTEIGRRGDRRVLGAALAAVCNLVNESSPLREVLLNAGLIPRLVQILELGDPELRISSLWAVKNLLYKTSTKTKKQVIDGLGSERLAEFLDDPNPGVQEQALHVVRNLAENEEGIELVCSEIGLREEVLLERLVGALWSSNEDVVLQAAFVLANLANGCDAFSQCRSILTNARILAGLHACLTTSISPSIFPSTSSSSLHPSAVSYLTSSRGRAETIRRPVIKCIVQLARMKKGPGRTAIKMAGFEDALRHVYEWGSTETGLNGVGSPNRGGAGGAGGGGGGIGALLSPGSGSGRGMLGFEGDGDVVGEAKIALDLLKYMD